jgi:hypothetical protein
MTTMLPLGRHSDSLWCRAQGSLATASYWEKRSFRELRCSLLVRGLQVRVQRGRRFKAAILPRTRHRRTHFQPSIAGTLSWIRIELRLLIGSI